MKIKLGLMCVFVFIYGIQSVNAQWVEMGFLGKDVRNVMVEDSVIYVGVAGDGLLKSTDNGTTWVQKNNGIFESLPTVTGIARRSNGLCLTTEDSLYYSFTNGDYWIDVHSHNLGSSYAYKNIKTHGTAIYLQYGLSLGGTLWGGEFTNDNGLTWQNNSWLHSVAIENDHVYLSYPDALYLSTDDYQTSTLQSSTANFGEFRMVCTADTQTVYRNTMDNIAPYTLRSTDSGVTWDSLCPGPDLNLLDMLSWNNELVAATGSAIYLSNNNVSGWGDITNDLPAANFAIYRVKMFNDTIYVCSNNGLYKMDLNQLAGINELNDPLGSITLFPNPTHAFVDIQLGEGTKDCQLRLYNAEGKMLKEITSSVSKITIDLSGYENGVYLLEVIGNNQVVSKRIVKM